MKFLNINSWSSDQIYRFKQARWRARYDLKFLCNEVLGYRDVSTAIHGELISRLQKFPIPDSTQFQINDDISKGYVHYTPLKPMSELEGARRNLILDFRGSLKTTINATAHTIQFILNYPNTSILIVQSNGEKAEQIVNEIKQHFQQNNMFRSLFPEHVPQRKVMDWGTIGEFTTEARDRNRRELGEPHKESTVICAGIDRGLAGIHVDMLKMSDIVDPTNAKTITGCKEVIKSYYLMENLLVGPKYWIDVEGTRYSYSDLYGKIIDDEAKLEPERRVWQIYVRSCYKRKTPDGGPQRFIPEELDYPFLIDEKAKSKRNPEGYVSWWPDRHPAEELEHKRAVSPFEFATQQLNSPRAAEDDMIPFPVNDQYPKWVDAKTFQSVIPVSYYEFGVDTAETDNQRSNYSAIAVGAWTANGNCVIVDIIHGKFLPDVLIDKLIEAYKKYKPQKIKIEKTSFVRGLMAGIRRECEKQGLFLPIEEVPTDNQRAKTDAILRILQPWYINGDLRFLNNLSAKKELLLELARFGAYEYDDILDAIRTLFANKEYFGRNAPRSVEKPARQYALNQELEAMKPKLWNAYLGIADGEPPNQPNSLSYNKTGGL